MPAARNAIRNSMWWEKEKNEFIPALAGSVKSLTALINSWRKNRNNMGKKELQEYLKRQEQEKPQDSAFAIAWAKLQEEKKK